MKYVLFMLVAFTATLDLTAQNVGINNTTPQTALDIDGRLRIRAVSLTVTGATVTIPNGNTGFHVLEGTPGVAFTVSLPTGVTGSFLLIENNTAQVATITGLTRIPPGKARLLLRGNIDWVLANDGESELERITEAGNTGWRMLGRDSAYYGNTGTDAVDLSYSSGASFVRGATGTYSFATGYNNTASGYNSTALGRATIADGFNSTAMGFGTSATGDFSTAFGNQTSAGGHFSTAMGQFASATGPWSTATGLSTNAAGNYTTAMGAFTTAKSYLSFAIGQYNDTVAGANATSWVATDPLFTIGNGLGPGFRSNAMTVYKNGTFDLQNLSSEPSITANKFYVWQSEPYYSGKNLHSQLERINEAGNTGWRILGRDAAYYGNIGFDAIDFSYHNAASATHGATGTRSVAMGEATTASNSHATAMGYQTTAAGTYSTSLGFNTTASGISSFALGNLTLAGGEAATAMGRSTTAGGAYATAMGFTSNASGQSSFAAGEYTIASGMASTALGNTNTASGLYSMATGTNNIASGNYSTTTGGNNIAAGSFSSVFGGNNNANGYASAAMGSFTTARAYASLAIGQYNDTIAGSSTSVWLAADPVLTVGIGTGPSNLANALTVYKNGNTDVSGYTRLGEAADGAPRIKVKKISTTLNGSAGASVPHGLTEGKILEMRVKVVNQFNSLVFDGNGIANNVFNAYIGGGNINIVGAAGNSNDIVNRPATILITYEE